MNQSIALVVSEAEFAGYWILDTGISNLNRFPDTS